MQGGWTRSYRLGKWKRKNGRNGEGNKDQNSHWGQQCKKENRELSKVSMECDQPLVLKAQCDTEPLSFQENQRGNSVVLKIRLFPVIVKFSAARVCLFSINILKIQT